MNALRRGMRLLPHLIVAALAVAMLVGVVIAHRYMPDPVPNLVQDLIHTLHGPGFAGVAFVIFVVLRIYHRSPMNYAYAGVAAMGIGVLAEASQIPGSRDAEVLDLIVNGIGVIGALGTIAIFDRELRGLIGRRRHNILGVVGGLAFAIAVGPTAWYGYSVFAQQQALPVLVSFENNWERAIYGQPQRQQPRRVDAPANWPLPGTVALSEEAQRYGILLRVNVIPDWTEYSIVSFLIASANDRTHEVFLSIRDNRLKGERRSVWYTDTYSIGTDPVRIEIPLQEMAVLSNNGRPFNMEQVETLVLSAANPGDGVTVYMDDFRLD